MHMNRGQVLLQMHCRSRHQAAFLWRVMFDRGRERATVPATRMPASAVSGSPSFGLGAVPVIAVPDDGDAEPAHPARRVRFYPSGQDSQYREQIPCKSGQLTDRAKADNAMVQHIDVWTVLWGCRGQPIIDGAPRLGSTTDAEAVGRISLALELFHTTRMCRR